MNQSQIKYARARAEAVFKKRNAAIVALHTDPGVKLTKAQKLLALTLGRFDVDVNCPRYGWDDAVTFTEERSPVVDQLAIDTEQAALAVTYRKLEDELVLGDNEAALALLQAFEGEAA